MEGTSMPYNNIKNLNIFSVNLLEILDKTEQFFKMQHSYFALANIWLRRYDSFFRFFIALG